MLAERFFLLLEWLIRSQAHLDGSPIVVRSSQFVPIALPDPEEEVMQRDRLQPGNNRENREAPEVGQ